MTENSERIAPQGLFDICRPATSTSALFNQRLKYYPTPDGGRILAEVCTFSESVFNPDKLEPMKRGGGKSRLHFESEEENTNKRSEVNAIKRARKRVFDLIACNDKCNLFVTLTLDNEKISRCDWTEISKRIGDWLDNYVRRHGLSYVLVPEFHADGKAVHFHGVMNESALCVRDSGHKRGGKIVFNIPSWSFGFSTAQRIGNSISDQIRVTKYISKYMTKQLKNIGETGEAKKVGGRYYLHGGKLNEPIYEYRNAPFEDAEGFAVEISNFLSCKIEGKL